MEVTASGVPRPRRNQLAQLVAQLRGTWSGALNVGRTAALVVEGIQTEIDWEAAKLAVALQHGIPVVSSDWLLDSQAHGFLLSTAPYRLEPPPPGRRSSAASTSAAAPPPRPAHTAATVNKPAAAMPPVPLQGSNSPGSPAAVELELLRAEAMPQQDSPLPQQRSPPPPAATPKLTSKLLVAPDELQEPLPSPVSGSPRLPAWPAGFPELPADWSGAGRVAVTPPLLSGGTDSDTKIARFFSRRPLLTLKRGSCLPRHCMLSDGGSSSSSSSSGTSIRSSLGGSASIIAERVEGACHCGMPARLTPDGSVLIPQAWAGEAAVHTQHVATAPNPSRLSTGSVKTGMAAATDSQEDPCASSTQRDVQPARSGQQSESMLRMEPPVAEGRLPATTLVRLGPQLHRPPLHSTWEGLLERHGCGSSGSNGHNCVVPRVTFHASADAMPEGGAVLNFAAGDDRHGAVMLYDILEEGRRVYALALVQAIYRWHDEVWMEHRYLLTREDLQDRQSWADALQRLEMRPGEVLLTVNSYFSPMHLIADDFQLSFPVRAQRGRRAQQAQAGGSTAEDACGPAMYTCRRGFDTTTGTVVPLRRALEGFGVA